MTTVSRLSCPPRYSTPRTPERPTLGPAIAAVAERLGKPLLPWQRRVADVIGEIDPLTGLLAYSEFGLLTPRQSGKSTFILAKFVHRGLAGQFFGPRQQMLYTAQTRKKAREKWKEDYVAQIEAAPRFRGKVVPAYGSGDEHLRFPNGSRFAIEANTEKAGHGNTLDEAYIDEAFAQVDGRLEQAFRPAMITRKNKQLGWISTAGWRGGSPYLESKVKRGREQAEMGVRDGLAYFEWSAPDDADPDDRDVWRSCMPALGHTISEQAIADELAAHRAEGKLNDFRRAYLNQWVVKSEDVEDGAFGSAGWTALADPANRLAGSPVFGVATAPDGSWSAIAMAWRREDGLAQVHLARNEQDVLDYRSGTAWVAPRLAELQRRWGGSVVTDKASRAFVTDAPTPPSPALVHNAFANAVEGGQLRHGNEPALNTSIRAAKWVPSGDSRVLDRKGSSDISPLVAAALALHGLQNAPTSGGWMVSL